MVMEIIAIRPNNREGYQDRVKNLCELLKDKDNKFYRFGVFLLLSMPAKALKRRRSRKIRDCLPAKYFLDAHPADVKAIQLMNELDDIYEEGRSENETDDLRGAVGEVFAHLILKKYTIMLKLR